MIAGELRVALAGVVALVTLVAFETMAVGTAIPVVAEEVGRLRHDGLASSLFLTAGLVGTLLAGGWAGTDRPGADRAGAAALRQGCPPVGPVLP